MENYAYFVKQPSRIKDLFRLHAVDQERRFVVTRVIELPLIDYENFIMDMTVDRQFLEENAQYCSKPENIADVWKCLLIKRKNHKDGILVITVDESWVGWAAYYWEGRQ